jgi:regulator of sirC expression with transglutaminase-like and TPR domain
MQRKPIAKPLDSKPSRTASRRRIMNAEANNSQTDYHVTVDLLTQVLKISPDDPVALFNRAIVYERLHLYREAIEDWRHYLRVDSNSTWNREARQRLADVEQALDR